MSWQQVNWLFCQFNCVFRNQFHFCSLLIFGAVCGYQLLLVGDQLPLVSRNKALIIENTHRFLFSLLFAFLLFLTRLWLLLGL